MNWLQKLCQLAPTYLGVGHNYRWNEETQQYEELWRQKGSTDVIIWYYLNGSIIEEVTNQPHWIDGDDARGRIEVERKRGSVTFNTSDYKVQKNVLENLIEKYPDVQFGVYTRGGPYTIQQYWEKFL